MEESTLRSATLSNDDYALTAADKERFAVERRRGLLPPNDPRLAQPVAEVAPNKITAKRIQNIVARLHEVAVGQRIDDKDPAKRRTLVGLAAPQIGELVRIVLIDTEVDKMRRHYGTLECFINPQIVWRSRETDEWREGCFSTGPVWGLVRRPLAVKIRAFDKTGRRIERIFEGFTARVACHEIDHLNGVRFPDIIKSDKKRHWVHAEELGVYPGEIKRWQRVCSRERWEALKHP